MPYIAHYGIKGMHWGVRRTKEELMYDKYSVTASTNRMIKNVVTKNGIKMTSLSDHAGNQARDRKVSSKSIVDAVKNPLYINKVKYDDIGRPSQHFIGAKATLSINPETGVIASLWPTGKRILRKYSKGE